MADSASLRHRIDWTKTIVPFAGMLMLCILFILFPEGSKHILERTRKFFGDEEVSCQIREALSKIREEFHPDPDKTELKADFPIYISHIFEDRYPIKVTIRMEQGSYYLKMSRFRLIPGEEPKVLVTFPELSYVDLVTELKFRLEDVGVIKIPEKGETFLADGFTKNELTNALEFYSGGECIAAVEARWYVIDVAKEKKLKKMNQGDK